MLEFNPDKVRELRTRESITLEQMSERSGLSKQVLSTWETGACEPRISSLNRLAAAMGVPFDFFFTTNETIVVTQDKVPAK